MYNYNSLCCHDISLHFLYIADNRIFLALTWERTKFLLYAFIHSYAHTPILIFCLFASAPLSKEFDRACEIAFIDPHTGKDLLESESEGEGAPEETQAPRSPPRV